MSRLGYEKYLQIKKIISGVPAYAPLTWIWLPGKSKWS